MVIKSAQMYNKEFAGTGGTTTHFCICPWPLQRLPFQACNLWVSDVNLC